MSLSLPSTMPALVYGGVGDLHMEDRPVPHLEASTDALVEVTLSSICTSDLHIRNGAVPRAVPGTVLGHEFVGRIVDLGDDVRGLEVGQRVSANVETFCGTCWFCRRGYVNNCVHGGWELGCRIDGCQTLYVRVPFAANGLDPLPDSVSDEAALLVGDVLASGHFGAELASIRPGDTVAVVGAGPVGLCAMQCARVFGAGTVVALDPLTNRLNLARARGWADEVVPMPLKEEDMAAGMAKACEAVRALSGGRGADAVIECAGTAASFELSWRLARPNATVAVVALYEEPQVLPLPSMYGKNLVFKTGGVDAVHSPELIRLIERGRIDTTPVLTHRFTLDDIMNAYRVFEFHEDGCIKTAVRPK